MLLAVTTSCGKIACSVVVMSLNTLVYIISIVALAVVIFCASASSSINSALRQFDTSDELHMPLSKHLLVACKSENTHVIMYIR